MPPSAPSVTFEIRRVDALDPAPQPVSESARAAITSGVTIVRLRISNLQVLCKIMFLYLSRCNEHILSRQKGVFTRLNPR